MRILTIIVYLFSLALIISGIYSNAIEIEEMSNFINEINADTFNSTIENNNIFIEFYTEWCGHCRALDKVLVESAKNLNGKSIIIAKIDVGQEENKKIASLFNVDSYPTFYYISEGQYIHYLGSKTTKGFTEYLMKELDNNVSKWELKIELPQVNSLSSDKKGLLLFIGDNQQYLKMFKVYRRIAESYKSKVKFYWTNSSQFYNKFNIKPNKFGLIYYNYLLNQGEYNEAFVFDLQSDIEIKDRLKMFFSQIFIKMNAKKFQKIIDKGLSTLILFYQDKTPENLRSETNKLINTLIRNAERYKGDFIFTKMDYSDENLGPIFDSFELFNREDPTCIIVNPSQEGDMRRYKMNETLTAESFTIFMENFKKHKLEKFINSQRIPVEPLNQNGVIKIVRKTLNSTVFDNNEDEFLILYCIENTRKCQQISHRFNEISKRFANSKNLKFAEYDANLNENDIIDIKTIPELIYLPASSLKKPAEFRRFIGNYTSQEMIEFIQHNVITTVLIANPSENEDSFWKNETRFSANKILDEEEQTIEDKTEEGEAESDEEAEEADGEGDKEDDKHEYEEENTIKTNEEEKIELKTDL